MMLHSFSLTFRGLGKMGHFSLSIVTVPPDSEAIPFVGGQNPSFHLPYAQDINAQLIIIIGGNVHFRAKTNHSPGHCANQ